MMLGTAFALKAHPLKLLARAASPVQFCTRCFSTEIDCWNFTNPRLMLDLFLPAECSPRVIGPCNDGAHARGQTLSLAPYCGVRQNSHTGPPLGQTIAWRVGRRNDLARSWPRKPTTVFVVYKHMTSRRR